MILFFVIFFYFFVLSKQPCSRVRPTELLFKRSELKGFWLTAYLQRKNMLQLLRMSGRVMALITTDLRCEFGQTYALDEVAKAVASSNPDQGKSLISPHH